MNSSEEGIRHVLDFWFEPNREKQWFVRSDAFDAEVAEALGPLHNRACAGDLDSWRKTPEGAVALVLLLDQVPRQLFRKSPDAFGCDELAREVTLDAVAAGFDEQLDPAQQLFLYLPLEHSEAINHQALSVAKFRALTRQAPESARELYETFERYAVDHHDLIAEYGRYPYRNAVLGRESTERERAYLSGGGATFGQG